MLPGLGPAATIAMLLPATFGLPPLGALIMLAGIFYGAQYGGSTTAILVNLPGESASVVTAIDGYQMARQGKAGRALAVAAIASLFAGTVCTLMIALFAPPLAELALNFGPAEYFSLMVLGLIASIVLASGSILHALGMVVLGLLLGLVGTDVNSGTQRFSFGFPELVDGINFVIVAMGMFGIGEIISNLEQQGSTRDARSPRSPGLLPTREDWRRMIGADAARHGCSARRSASCRAAARRWPRSAPMRWRRRSRRTAPSSARAPWRAWPRPKAPTMPRAQMSFIPMLTLGIPSNPVMALMIGAMFMQGIQPGPGVITEQPTLFWGLIASMWIGNLMLLILNLPLIGIWVKMLSVPYHLLYPMILLFCAIGVFSLSNSTFDVYLMVIFGALGYVFKKLDCEPAPLLLGYILGPMMEETLRRALLISKGDPIALVNRPISATMLALAAVLLVLVLLPAFSKTRERGLQGRIECRLCGLTRFRSSEPLQRNPEPARRSRRSRRGGRSARRR